MDNDYGAEILGYDDEDVLNESEAELALEDYDDASDQEFDDYRRTVRVEENKRFEKNRRAGGRTTQKSMEKAWKVSAQCRCQSL